MMVPKPKVVAFGGGHGLSATLNALRETTAETTAVVTVADDGGSSGRLRQDYPILPPGDLRMALAALCAPDNHWRTLLQYRFDRGDLRGHPVGNILLAALWNESDDPVKALDKAAELIGIRGRVLPMCRIPLEIVAEVSNSDGIKSSVRGQAAVASTSSRIESFVLAPADATATVEAVDAVRQADLLVLGPGSWFTSVLPALGIREIQDAVRHADGRRVLIMNLEAIRETSGFTPVDHLEALQQIAPAIVWDYIIVDRATPGLDADFRRMTSEVGAELIEADLRSRERPGTHDTRSLERVFRRLLDALD